jgi:hypothetical protein
MQKLPSALTATAVAKVNKLGVGTVFSVVWRFRLNVALHGLAVGEDEWPNQRESRLEGPIRKLTGLALQSATELLSFHLSRFVSPATKQVYTNDKHRHLQPTVSERTLHSLDESVH